MVRDHDAIEAALRVLACVASRKNPDPLDEDVLRSTAPDLEKLRIDDVACAVIRRLVLE